MRNVLFATLLMAVALLAACSGGPATTVADAPVAAAGAESITVYKSPT